MNNETTNTPLFKVKSGLMLENLILNIVVQRLINN